MQRFFATAALAIALPMTAQSATVDLSGWIENGFKGNNGAGTWTVQTGNDTVSQSTNGSPTVFFESGSNAQGTSLSGSINVSTHWDDDYIGFVLGYQADEFNSAAADFWLIDWKRNTQGAAVEGLSLSHVTGDITSAPEDDFWSHSGVVNEVQRAATLGDTGYVQNQNYNFDLIFTDSLIEVKVDGATELSLAGSFTDGAFGFYNYSQQNVTYAGITEDIVVAPVPLPAGLPMLVAGLAGFGVLRRRSR